MRLWRLILPLAALAAVLAYILPPAEQAAAPKGEVEAGDGTLPPSPYPPGLHEEAGRVAGFSIRFHEESDVPDGLPWRNGGDFPEIGDAAACKGGTMRLCNVGPFPANLLAFGSPSPQFFHYNLFTMVEVPLVREHPSTGQEIPGLAMAWATEGDTVYFRLNPAARYSNGRPVRAGDFALGALLRCKAGKDGQWEQLRRAASSLHVYGDGVLALTLRRASPAMPLLAAQVLHPAEPGFYAAWGNDYSTRYAWRIPPTTGGYTVGDIQRGRKISLVRVKNWWAKDLPGFRHTCNVDTIEHHFLTDEAQAWEFLLRGKLDALQTRNMAAWQRFLESRDPSVERGEIVPRTFTLEYPFPPYGIALNVRTLPDIELRRGLMQAMDMERAMDVLFHNEAERLTSFTSGYRHIRPGTRPLPYNPAAARACFARAGYTQQGADGILRKEDGTRLSVRFTYVPSDKTNTLASILAQSAAACGAEIVADAVPWQLCARKVQEGTHQLTFWASVPSVPLPDHTRFFHSEARGADAPFGLDDPGMDAALEDCAQAPDWTACAAAYERLDKLIQKLAIWLPGWKENRAYLAAWEYVRFPARMEGVYDVLEAHTYWLSPPGKKP